MIFYYSASTGSCLFFGRTFWWPEYMRKGKRKRQCGILLTYADEKEARKVMGDLAKGVRSSPIRKQTRAIFGGMK